jgi:hypothetical protein
MTESQIEQAILRYLNKNGIFAFKFKDNTRSESGKHRRPSPFQINGVSDICIIHNSAVYWVEIKTEKGRQTEDQIRFQNRVTDSGGTYLLWRCIGDAKEWLKTKI